MVHSLRGYLYFIILFVYFMFCPMAFLGGLPRFGVFVYYLSVIPMTVTEKKIRLDLLMYKVEYIVVSITTIIVPILFLALFLPILFSCMFL